MKLVGVLLAVLALAALPSSSGCGSKSAADAKKELEKLKKKEKPKPPFEPLRVFCEPNEKSFTDPKDLENQVLIRNAIKPGHWTGVLVEAKANNFDFGGELFSEPRDNQQNMVDLEGSFFGLVLSRPVALAKGQKKTLEAIFFAPPLDRSAMPTEELNPSASLNPSSLPTLRRTSTWMYNQLRGSQHGIESRVDSELLPHMPSFQYFMVVLSRDPGRYRYLKVLECVRPAGETAANLADESAFYRTLFPRTNQPLALPAQALCWTSVAYVVWDDVLPSMLTPDQQRALLDWLHWGGGLIVSGPQTLDALRGSFLDPYLPASGAETVSLDAGSLAELNAHWTVPDPQARRLPIVPVQPWSGVKLVKHPAADFLAGTGELVVERRVGRGRIVATAFRLNEQDLVNWRSFDSFFNACILRRPNRRFEFTHNQFEFIGRGAARRFDPELVSNVRYFTRDAQELSDSLQRAAVAEAATRQAAAAKPPFPVPATYVPPTPFIPDDVSELDQIEASRARPGVAAWNDFSKVSATAGHALREAAGIAVPKREFVLWMVGLYLLLIVPLNWLAFRLLGRVEWAWFAVPVIALGWGAVVIWLAQLDIGFARAETEISVVEAQSGFPRAHLTRYTALYSSLSTSYSVHFDDPSSVAQPFAVDLRLLQGQRHSTVMFRNVGEHQLTDYMVSSNSTGMVHSEQMFDLAGSLDWQSSPDQPARLENNTNLKLSGVALVRRRLDDAKRVVDETAWLGDLPRGAKVDVTFEPHDAASLAAARDRSPLTTGDRPEGSLSLRRLVAFAESHQSLEPGDVRLVAWQDQKLAGVRIEPAAAQARRATLVVANLQFGTPAAPVPDANQRAQPDPVAEQPLPAAASKGTQ
jgi:hypothetical protein